MFVDYGSTVSVRKYNKGTDMYRQAARDIGIHYPERVSDFAELLHHEDDLIRVCAAVSIVDLMPHTVAQLLAAKAIITERLPRCDGAEKRDGNGG